MGRKPAAKMRITVIALAAILAVSLTYLAHAVPTQDNSARYWKDSFTDQSGIAALSNLNFSAGYANGSFAGDSL